MLATAGAVGALSPALVGASLILHGAGASALRGGSGIARVFITGSADGLGRLAAQTLLDEGHAVVAHVRNNERLARSTTSSAAAPPPSSAICPTSDETRALARDVNGLGQMDAVIHNAGVDTARTCCPSTSSLPTCSPR